MQITLELPDELAAQLSALGDQLPQVLEYGLRELNAAPDAGLDGVADILEFLATLPTPEEIIALRPSADLQARIQELLENQQTRGLTSDEERLWQHYEYLEHLIRIAKAKAFLKLQQHRAS